MVTTVEILAGLVIACIFGWMFLSCILNMDDMFFDSDLQE
jgi:hypothetical protein